MPSIAASAMVTSPATTAARPVIARVRSTPGSEVPPARAVAIVLPAPPEASEPAVVGSDAGGVGLDVVVAIFGAPPPAVSIYSHERLWQEI